MSDQIKHECGIALVRLLKPLEFYQEKYGTAFYGLDKMYLLMQKQHNRGQDGVGLASIKLDMEPGKRYISRKRTIANQPVKDLFTQIHNRFEDVKPELLSDPAWLKANRPYVGELMLGHLRYGTHGGNSIEACHPFLRKNNWITRTLLLAGNFNLTNVDELFEVLLELGQHPKEKSDTVTVMEKMGHFLDVEVQHLFERFKYEGHSNKEITELIGKNLDVGRILQRAAVGFDGGFTMGGMLGHGDAFVLRDSQGIRPAFYYMDDEVVVVTSERPPIQTAFNVHWEQVKEIKPGHALIIKKDGRVSEELVIQPQEQKSCSFERIYFSRGNDRDIYSERKKLGEQLAERVLEAVDYDFDNTVISYVPNTAETAFLGLVKGLEDQVNIIKKKKIEELYKSDSKKKEADLVKILNLRPRVEKIAIKDAKLRTFITQDDSRSELVSHVYDVTYGIVRNEVDTLVLLDDSIVRGTTLEQSILKIVARLRPKKIIIVSSAPQIRYPDCYGIDMSKMKDFIAFRALVALLKQDGKEGLLQETYKRCKAQENLPKEKITNEVAKLYELYTQEEISNKISEIVKPKDIKPEVEVIYQSIEGLHKAIPNHSGDWYFSGNFPTPGGNRVINQAFIYYMEKKDRRAY